MNAIAVMLMVTLAAAEAPASELEGTWNLVRIEVDGRVVAPTLFDSKKIIFTKCDYVYDPNGPASNRDPFAEGSYRCYAEQKPKGLDFNAKHPQSRDYIRKGIYEIDGDTLRFTLAKPGQPRPDDFGPGLRVEIWKRGRSNTSGRPEDS